MRRAIALAALLGLAGQAQAASRPMEGVWRGTIGKAPIMVCLVDETYSPARGSYYYLAHQQSIALDGGEDGAVWSEDLDGGAKAQWKLRWSSKGLAGTWSGKGKVLPIALNRVQARQGEDVSACETDEYLAPRVTTPRIVPKAADFYGQPYTLLQYDVGKGFADVDISSFVIPAKQPGDAAINRQLRGLLDPAKDHVAYLACLSGQIAQTGMDGDYVFDAAPNLVTDAFLGVEISEGGTCGGAHPSYGTSYQTFDRQTGKEVDPFTWLTPKGASVAKPDRDGWVERKLTPELRALIVSKMVGVGEECRQAFAEEDYWHIALDPRALRFLPSLPHVSQGCADPVSVEMFDLAPFLNAAGRAGFVRMGAPALPG